MQRLIIHALVAALTFTIGITTSVLLNSFRALSTGKTNGTSLTLSIETPTAPSKTYSDETTSRSCSCSHPTGEVVVTSSEPSVEKAPVSGGVLNGKAVRIPIPVYPALAKTAGAYGAVTVQVKIDERGCVISAHAVSGHPLLQAAAVQSARQACFTPTRLSGVPVKVTGVLVYKFERL